MSDERRTAIELLEAALERSYNDGTTWRVACFDLRASIEQALAAARVDAEARRWVAVEDELPEHATPVQAFHPHWGRREGYRLLDSVIGNWPGEERATHWAPMLPEPPEPAVKA